eukprot:gene12890-biopygen12841
MATHNNVEPLHSATTKVVSAPKEGSQEEEASPLEEGSSRKEEASAPIEDPSSPDEAGGSIIEECSPEGEAGAPEEGSSQEEEAGATEEKASVLEEGSAEQEEAGATEEKASVIEEGSAEQEEAGATEEKESVLEEGSPEQGEAGATEEKASVLEEGSAEQEEAGATEEKESVLEEGSPEQEEASATEEKASVIEEGSAEQEEAGATEEKESVLEEGILAKSGSSGSPTISFSNAPDTGLFNPVARTLGVVAGGTEMVRVSDTIVSLMGDLVMSSNIVPMTNATQYLGTSTMHFKEAWIDELHISSNTLYIGDTPVLCANNDTVSIRADPGQGITLTTTGDGETSLVSAKGVNTVTVVDNIIVLNSGERKKPLEITPDGITVEGMINGNGSGLTALNANNKSSETLAVVRGGTGVVTSTGTGSVVLSASPTLTGVVVLPSTIVKGDVTFDTGVNLFVNGADTAASPGYSWNGDANTGIYKVANDSIGFSCGGVNRCTINSSGISGVGTNLTSLNAANVSSGTLNGARIPDLDASKVTTGTLNATLIPNLNASKITAGTISEARLPVVDIQDVVELVEDLVVVIEYVFAVYENSKRVAHVHHEVLKAVPQKIEDELQRTPSVELAEYVCHRDYPVDRVRIERDLDVLQDSREQTSYDYPGCFADTHVKKTKSRRAWILYVLEKNNNGMTRVKLTTSVEKEQFCSNVLNTKVSDKFVCKDLNSATAFNEEIRTVELPFRNVSASGLAKSTTFSSITFKRFNVVGIDLGGKAILSRDSGFYVFSLRCSMSAASKVISSDADMDKFVRETLENFNVIHRAGIIHGDVKLDNMIYCAKDDRYRLIDWGKTADHADMLSRYVDNTRFGFVNNTSSPMAWFCSGLNYAASLVFMTMIVTRHMERVAMCPPMRALVAHAYTSFNLAVRSILGGNPLFKLDKVTDKKLRLDLLDRYAQSFDLYDIGLILTAFVCIYDDALSVRMRERALALSFRLVDYGDPSAHLSTSRDALRWWVQESKRSTNTKSGRSRSKR